MEDFIRKSLAPPTLDLSVDRNTVFQIRKKKWEDHILLPDLERKGDEFVLSNEDKKNPGKVWKQWNHFLRVRLMRLWKGTY